MHQRAVRGIDRVCDRVRDVVFASPLDRRTIYVSYGWGFKTCTSLLDGFPMNLAQRRIPIKMVSFG